MTHSDASAATDDGPPPAAQLLQMIMGKASTQLLYVVAELGIADLLGDGPMSVAELAAVTDADEAALYRVLRALAGMGVFAETGKRAGERRFELTPLARPLRSDASDSVRDFARMAGSRWHNRAWAELLQSVMTGEPAFNLAFDEDLFDHLTAHPDRFDLFNAAMTSLSNQDADAMLRAYDFSDLETIVDVGGGHGYLLTEILKAHPGAHGVLLEIPDVARGARETTREAGVGDRCEVIEGDFFETVPEGGDLYILKLIIHDWDDGRAVDLLRNCRRAMADDAKLLVANSVIPPGNDPYPGKMIDIEMLAMTPGGRERTEEEFRQLFQEAGFELSRTIPTASYLFLLEGRPA